MIENLKNYDWSEKINANDLSDRSNLKKFLSENLIISSLAKIKFIDERWILGITCEKRNIGSVLLNKPAIDALLL